jgi:hypothetical protein
VCTACLKDLQRLLRQDDSETKEAFQILGHYNIATSDLVPIIVTYPKETDIVYNARELVLLTAFATECLQRLRSTPTPVTVCSQGVDIPDNANRSCK